MFKTDFAENSGQKWPFGRYFGEDSDKWPLAIKGFGDNSPLARGIRVKTVPWLQGLCSKTTLPSRTPMYTKYTEYPPPSWFKGGWLLNVNEIKLKHSDYTAGSETTLLDFLISCISFHFDILPSRLLNSVFSKSYRTYHESGKRSSRLNWRTIIKETVKGETVLDPLLIHV